MKKAAIFLAACGMAALATPAAAVVYGVNVSGNGVSAVGSITTDGTLGALTQSNITDWTFDLDDGSSTFTLNGAANSQLGFFSAPSLTATATGLFFDFSGSGAVLFQNPQIGSGVNFICFAGNQICGGDNNRISISVSNFGGGIAQQGIQQIGTAAAVPEAGTWALMILGMGGVGGALRTRSRRVRFAA